MISLIISSKSKEKREEHIRNFLLRENIDKFDVSHTGIEQSKNRASIGIEDIKTIQKKAYLKPIISLTKAVILNDAHLLTVEAQNALLKLLEEPPDRTVIILSTDTIESLLPTILSRCQIILLEKDAASLSGDETKEVKDFINKLQEMKIGDRLKLAEKLAKDKEETIAWIGKIILYVREKMLSDGSNHNLAEYIKSFQQLHTLLKTTNVNPRFAIENTLLSITS